MDILKSLGLKNKDQADNADQKNKPVSQEQKKSNPHASGGCCGSCGGQKQN